MPCEKENFSNTSPFFGYPDELYIAGRKGGYGLAGRVILENMVNKPPFIVKRCLKKNSDPC
jgi:hypothetical protein